MERIGRPKGIDGSHSVLLLRGVPSAKWQSGIYCGNESCSNVTWLQSVLQKYGAHLLRGNRSKSIGTPLQPGDNKDLDRWLSRTSLTLISQKMKKPPDINSSSRATIGCFGSARARANDGRIGRGNGKSNIGDRWRGVC